MLDVALEGERRGSVPGEGLEIPYGLPVARQQAQATLPEVMEPDSGAAPLGQRPLFSIWFAHPVPHPKRPVP